MQYFNQGGSGIHHSKYWMPIHYDTIADGQNKKSHLLFSNLRVLCRDPCIGRNIRSSRARVLSVLFLLNGVSAFFSSI